jgi:hypothetical protein
MSDYTIAATEATKEHKSRGTKTNYKQQNKRQQNETTTTSIIDGI